MSRNFTREEVTAIMGLLTCLPLQMIPMSSEERARFVRILNVAHVQATESAWQDPKARLLPDLLSGLEKMVESAHFATSNLDPETV